MRWIRKIGGWFWNNLSNLALLVGWIGASTISGLSAKAAGVFSQYAPFSWTVIGLIGGLIAGIAYLLWAVAKNITLLVKVKQNQIRKADSIDPMESIFQNKRINIADLVNPYNQVVSGKKFIGCELIGPVNILPMLGAWKFIGNNLTGCDSIEIKDDCVPQNVVAFVDCDFEKCTFFKTTFLFQAKFRESADNIISDMHWLTPTNEPVLPLGDLIEKGDDNTHPFGSTEAGIASAD